MSSPHKKLILLSPRANVIAAAITLIIAGVVPVLLSNYYQIDREIVNAVRTILFIILGIMLGGVVLQYLFIYLEPAISPQSVEETDSEDEPSSSPSDSVFEQFDDIKPETENAGTAKSDSRNQNKKTKEPSKSNIGRGFIAGFEEIRERLNKETNTLARRANLNLIIGIIITGITFYGIIAVLPLDLKDLYADDKFRPAISAENYGWTIITHFIPRLSFIVLAQLFAYFFLRLYKSGLDDIKYYQNEITNIELKLSALKVALDTRDYKGNETLKLVIGELAKVERNSVLKKDETTVELEKFKIESANENNLLAHVKTLLETKK